MGIQAAGGEAVRPPFFFGREREAVRPLFFFVRREGERELI